MADEKIAGGYVEIVANTTKLNKGLNDSVKDAEKAAKQIENAFKKGTIKLDDRLAKMSVKELQAEYKKFENAVAKDIKMGLSQAEVKRTISDLNLVKSKLEDVGVKAETTGISFGKMFGAIAAGAILAKIGHSLANFAKDAITAASKIEGIKAAFDKLNQPNLLGNIQKATRGTVTDLELMQRSVMANNFKIPLEQLATYFKFATNRAIETGQSVDYLVESIITGVGRKSVLVMDNLGISAVELQQEVAKVGDFGKAAGIIIQRELAKAGDVADTLATKTARISTAWGNFQTAVGQSIVSFGSGLAQLLGFVDLAALINDQTRRMKEFFGVVDKGYSSLKSSKIDIFTGLGEKERKQSLIDETKRLNILLAQKAALPKPQKVRTSFGTTETIISPKTKKERAELEEHIKNVKANMAAINQINADIAKGTRDINGNLIKQADTTANIDALKADLATKEKELLAIQSKGGKAGIEELKAATLARDEVKGTLEALKPAKEDEIKLTNKLEAELSKLTEQYNSLADASSPQAQKLAAKIAGLQAETDKIKEQKDELLLLERQKLAAQKAPISGLSGAVKALPTIQTSLFGGKNVLSDIYKKMVKAQDEINNLNLTLSASVSPEEINTLETKIKLLQETYDKLKAVYDLQNFQISQGVKPLAELAPDKLEKVEKPDKIKEDNPAKKSFEELHPVMLGTLNIANDLRDVSLQFTNTLSNGITGMITKAMTLKDVLNDIAGMVLSSIIQFGVKAGLTALTGGAGGFFSDVFGNVMPSAPTVPTVAGVNIGQPSASQGSDINALTRKMDSLIQATINTNEILINKDMTVNIAQGKGGIEYLKNITRGQDSLTRAGFKP